MALRNSRNLSGPVYPLSAASRAAVARSNARYDSARSSAATWSRRAAFSNRCWSRSRAAAASCRATTAVQTAPTRNTASGNHREAPGPAGERDDGEWREDRNDMKVIQRPGAAGFGQFLDNRRPAAVPAASYQPGALAQTEFVTETP